MPNSFTTPDTMLGFTEEAKFHTPTFFPGIFRFIQEITQMRHQTLIDPLQRKLPIL